MAKDGLKPIPVTRLDENHQDFVLLSRLENAILRYAKGKERFEEDIPKLLRQAIDEVIDAPRSRRYLLDELEKTEKTYLGTKIEILLRNHLKLEKGARLDVVIDGIEVDIKNTTAKNWMIPKEAIDNPCILIRVDERVAKCWFGLVFIRNEILRKGENRDRKSSISAANFVHVHWMLYDFDYPMNFWEKVPTTVRKRITASTSGTQRLVALFSLYLGKPISRQVVLALAPQKDSMKRLRKNGGARDALQASGVALLSGTYDHELINRLGLPFCAPDDFISIKPVGQEAIRILQTAGHL